MVAYELMSSCSHRLFFMQMARNRNLCANVGQCVAADDGCLCARCFEPAFCTEIHSPIVSGCIFPIKQAHRQEYNTGVSIVVLVCKQMQQSFHDRASYLFFAFMEHFTHG